MERVAHPLDAALDSLGDDASGATRLRTVWRYYSRATGDELPDIPSPTDRARVYEWLRAEFVGTSGPILMTRRTHIESLVSLDAVFKASHLSQGDCGYCHPVTRDDGTRAMYSNFALGAEAWPAAGPATKAALREVAKLDLLRRGRLDPWHGAVCLTIVALVPGDEANEPGARPRADDLTGDALETLQGILYDDVRQVQCLATRRVAYLGSEGGALFRGSAVEPYLDDVVFPEGRSNRPAATPG